MRGRQAAFPAWLYHHLAVSGPAADVADFAAAARGSGVIPWWLDAAALEKDVFNLAASQPPHRRHLTMTGCRILARQFRERIEARQDRAMALVGQSRACRWTCTRCCPSLARCCGSASATRRRARGGPSTGYGAAVAGGRAAPGIDRTRLPAGHAVVGYGFSTAGDTPAAAVQRLRPRWPALRFALAPRPSG